MGKPKFKKKSVSLAFKITRVTDPDGAITYQLRTEGEDGRASIRPVRPAWHRHGDEMKVTAHDAIDMAREDLWAAIMGANL